MTDIELSVHDQNGEETDSYTLSTNDLGGEIRIDLMHQFVVTYLANNRQGNASTKNRSEVSYSTKKPWPQKSTGRARAGTRRSPIWVGGGITFGAKPRDFSKDMPKKMKQRAFESALLSKFLDEEVVLLNELDFPAPKTKQARELLDSLDVEESSLLLGQEYNRNAHLSTRNLPDTKYKPISDTNAYEILNYDLLIIDQQALEDVLQS